MTRDDDTPPVIVQAAVTARYRLKISTPLPLNERERRRLAIEAVTALEAGEPVPRFVTALDSPALSWSVTPDQPPE